MSQKIPTGVVVAVIALVVVVAAYFGWHTLSGGSSGDITQEKIQYYQSQVKKQQEHKFTSPQEAAKAGAPMGSAVPIAPSGSAPTGSR